MRGSRHNWYLIGLVVSSSVALWPLAFRAVELNLDEDSSFQIEAVCDRANRPEAPESEMLPLFGTNQSPALTKPLLLLPRVVSCRAFVVILNVVTALVGIMMPPVLLLAYRHTFKPDELFLALLSISIAPLYVYICITYHPCVWSLGLLVLALWLTSTSSSTIGHLVAPGVLFCVAYFVRMDAAIFAPVILQRLLSRYRLARPLWYLSFVAPVAGLAYYHLTGDEKVVQYWTLKRLVAELPDALVKSMGITGALGLLILPLRAWRKPSREWCEVLLSWALPTVVFWGSNASPVRHVFLLSFAAGFLLFLENPLLVTSARRRWGGALVWAAIVGQGVIGANAVLTRVDALRERRRSYESVLTSSSNGNFLNITYYPYRNAFAKWVVASSEQPYNARYFTPPQGVGDHHRMHLVTVHGNRVLVVPSGVANGHHPISEIVRAAVLRAGVSVPLPDGAIGNTGATELIPVSALEIDRVLDLAEP